MERVHYIEAGQQVPAGNKLTVKKLAGGQFNVDGYLGSAIANLGFGVENNLRLALLSAQKQAARLGITDIYVIGVSDAERP